MSEASTRGSPNREPDLPPDRPGDNLDRGQPTPELVARSHAGTRDTWTCLRVHTYTPALAEVAELMGHAYKPHGTVRECLERIRQRAFTRADYLDADWAIQQIDESPYGVGGETRVVPDPEWRDDSAAEPEA